MHAIARATLALVLLAGIAGCAAEQKVATFTQSDLQNAMAIDTQAAASTDPSISGPAKVKLACDNWVSENLATLQAQAAAAPVTGIFSATSAADIAANRTLEALGPAGQASFELGCGPEITHVVGLVTGFKALQIYSPAAVMALK